MASSTNVPDPDDGAHDTPTREPLEVLLEEYLERSRRGETVRVEDYVAAHPDLAGPIRDYFPLAERLENVASGSGDAARGPDQRIGRYLLRRELGRGGQGTVYLAEDPVAGGLVAIKVLAAGGALNREALVRFRREARSLAQLEHPSICAVLEEGEDRGRLYLVMEYVPGIPLRQALPPDAERDRVLAVFEQAARALHVAHEQGVVHRDVKPANILVTTEDRPVLLDFGLARQDEAAGATVTRTGALVGTPPYLAPEQVRGGRADRRTDVYALGVTLYETLTGRRPFEALTREGLYREILLSPPPDPRPHRSVPEDLWTVIQTALEKEPERRYQTAQDLAEELGRVRSGTPILARAPGPVRRLRRWVRGSPVLATSLLAVMALLGAALLLTTLFLSRLRGELARTRAHALVGASVQAMRSDPTLGLLLAREATVVEVNPATTSQLQRALSQCYERTILDTGAAVLDVRLGPEEEWFLTLGGDGVVRQWTAAGELLREFADLDGPAMDAFLDPDARTLITAAGDGPAGRGSIARLWNLETGESRTLRHGDALSRPFDLPFAPRNGRLTALLPGAGIVVSGARDGAVRFWDLEGQELEERRIQCGSSVASLTVLADEEILVGTGRGDLFRVAPDGTRQDLPAHGNAVLAGGISCEGQVATASSDGTVRLWDLKTGTYTSLPHGFAVHGLCFSPEGDALLSYGNDRIVREWSLQGERRAEFHGHQAIVRDARYSRDGRLVVTASQDAAARVFRRNGNLHVELRGHKEAVTFASFLEDGTRVLTGSMDGTVRFWQWSDAELPVLLHQDRPVFRGAITPDEEHLITTSLGTVSWWQRDGRKRSTEQDAPGFLKVLEVLPDGGVLTASPGWRQVHLSRDAAEVLNLDTSADPIAVRATPSGDQVLSLERDSAVRVYRFLEPDWELETEVSLGHVFGLSLDREPHDPLTFAVGTQDGQVLFANETGVQGARSVGAAGVQSLVFSPDGSWLAAGTEDGTLRLLENRGTTVVPLRGHTGRIQTVVFSPDGDRVLSASVDRTVRLWSLDGRELQQWSGEMFWSAAFFPRSPYLLTTSADGIARVWVYRPEDLLRLAGQRLSRSLTVDERAQYRWLLSE